MRGEGAVKLERQDQIGILFIDTERNNAINDAFIREAHELMDEAEADPATRALVVTSSHKAIFCPGVDLPSLMGRSGPEMRSFYEALTGIVRRKVAYPKPEVYALNGHCIAGGCRMALAGDYRVMARGHFAFGMMEIDVGLTAPIGIVEMLRHFLGGRVAERVLFSRERFTPERAFELGLLDEVVEPDKLMQRACEQARSLASKPAGGYRRLKRYSRQALAARMHALDDAHLDELVDQWFSEETQRLVGAAVQRMKKPAAATA
jgi:enoyl-CoA hydratase/carnithine racemase